MIASDIDGTILGHDGKISERTIRAFHACRDAGIETVFVTGRPPRWLQPLREQMGHTGTVICSNGAVVWNLEVDSVVSAHAMELDLVLRVRDIIKELRPSAIFAAETLTGLHVEPGFVENDESGILADITPAPLEKTLGRDSGVLKFLAVVREGTADEFLAAVRPAVGDLASVTHSTPSVAMLEIALPGINKAVTLAAYADSLGIDARDVFAFGDMPNDVEMLRWAGHGYAMANGHPDAISAAGQSAPHFDDDGVAQVLEGRLAELNAEATA